MEGAASTQRPVPPPGETQALVRFRRLCLGNIPQPLFSLGHPSLCGSHRAGRWARGRAVPTQPRPHGHPPPLLAAVRDPGARGGTGRGASLPTRHAGGTERTGRLA